MELKSYQKRVLRDLEDYISVLNGARSLSAAYSRFWLEKGVDIVSGGINALKPYVNTVPLSPRVTLKVPTAGGKTFIACNALGSIMERLRTGEPYKAVVWFVPSDTILKQTLGKLRDPLHPYRQQLDKLFAHRVRVVDKDSALAGQGISPERLRDELTVFVLSAQSFIENVRVRAGAGSELSMPLAFRENGNLLELAGLSAGSRIEGVPDTALIQVLAALRPVVIVDESHNFKADLRVEMLQHLSPRFILELTATPRDNSNVISFVDAMELKVENMVKLPVMVENRRNTGDVIASAIRMRNSLEKRAVAMEAAGGSYVRPIVLFQAQPKNAEGSVTFEKTKKTLESLGIPPGQIKIKTADKDELRGVDLMSPSCPVRYIITVNALKEGWDCPFAYILASLANRSSPIEVEQVLGRVLRLPHTVRHPDELLNLSYVFTNSNDFQTTVTRIIESLMNCGFSRKDFRQIVGPGMGEATAPEPTTLDLFDIPSPDQAAAAAVEQAGLVSDSAVEPTGLDSAPAAGAPELSLEPSATSQATAADGADDEPDQQEDDFLNIPEEELSQVAGSLAALEEDEIDADTERLQQEALSQEKQYSEQVRKSLESAADDPLSAMGPAHRNTFNPAFALLASQMRIPMFHLLVQTEGSLFTQPGEEWVPLDKATLTEGFNLVQQDSVVSFSTVRSEGTAIDIAQNGADDYVPVRRSNNAALRNLRQHFVDLAADKQKVRLAAALSREVASDRRLDGIPQRDIEIYIANAVSSYDGDDILYLWDNLHQTKDVVMEKILGLLDRHREAMFDRWIEIDRIQTRDNYVFARNLTFARQELVGIDKGLYEKEEAVNSFEMRVLQAVSELDNVLFWHRNPDRSGGFCINGFINHYPDFILRLESGRTVMVETKGAHLDNPDTQKKIRLGRKWADKCGQEFKYFMVFENDPPQGACTFNQLLELLKEL